MNFDDPSLSDLHFLTTGFESWCSNERRGPDQALKGAELHVHPSKLDSSPVDERVLGRSVQHRGGGSGGGGRGADSGSYATESSRIVLPPLSFPGRRGERSDLQLPSGSSLVLILSGAERRPAGCGHGKGKADMKHGVFGC